LVFVVVLLLGAVPGPALAAQNDGATKKSLFLSLPERTVAEVSSWVSHVCSEHRDPTKDDYIYNLVVYDVTLSPNTLQEALLREILPHVPGGGGTRCFDNLFVGPEDPPQWIAGGDTPAVQPWCLNSPYCGGILTPSYRWANINANRAAADLLLTWVNANFPGVRSSINWYVTYEAYFDWIGDNGYSTEIRSAYEAYLLQMVREFNGALRAAGEPASSASRAILWSPTYENAYAQHSSTVLANIRSNLRMMFKNIKNIGASEGITRGVDWLDMQDKLGQEGCFTSACYANVKSWFDFLKTVSDAQFSFASLRVNMEQFKPGYLSGDLSEHMARENYYESKKMPVGASWEMKYWIGTHAEK
jgi:hypothetical protein